MAPPTRTWETVESVISRSAIIVGTRWTFKLIWATSALWTVGS